MKDKESIFKSYLFGSSIVTVVVVNIFMDPLFNKNKRGSA
jgi:hypothetical protein